MSRILLVDDDTESRSSVQSYFQTRGHDVVTTRAERPDAVVIVVQKPTALDALYARVQEVLKSEIDVLVAGDLVLDRVRHRVTRGGEEIPLTLTEFNLLEYLLRNKNVALTRKQILEAVWGGTVDGFTNIVDVYVNYLRKKIERVEGKKLLKTVRGVGYMLEE